MSRHTAGWLAISLLTLCCSTVFCPSTARAENAGQAALDQATEAKLSAEGFEDLAEVIRLCRSALRLGLDEKNTTFASEMLASTLTQRAEIVSTEIFDHSTPSPRWPELRRLALSDLEESLTLNAEQPDAQYMVGRLNSLPGGDRARAKSALDAAVRLTEKDPPARSKALLIRAGLGEDDEQRLADYNEAVKIAPRSAEAFRSRGLYYLSKDEFDPALADLDKAIEFDPTSADSFEAKGVAQFMMKDYDASLKTLDKAIELAPEIPLAYTHRARIYAIRGDNDQALADLAKALELQPRAIDFLLLRARVYQQARKFDKALIDVNQVLRLSPGLEDALKLHAMLAAGTGRIDQAISDLEELNIETPDNTELMLQLALFYAADKQPQKAVDTYGEVLAKDPKSWLAYRGRADAYLSLSKQSAALDDYEAALKLHPEDSGILNNLAWLLGTSTEDNLRNGKRAIELATEACKLTDYKQAHILSTLAASYAETGDFETAMKWSRKAVELGGSKEMKEQLGKELDSYKQHKAWREETPPNLAVEAGEEAEDDSENIKASAAEPGDDDSASKN
jgi:tetratricopeptide (TPR) repeat protein